MKQWMRCYLTNSPKEHGNVEEQDATISDLKSVVVVLEQDAIKALNLALKEQAAQIRKIASSRVVVNAEIVGQGPPLPALEVLVRWAGDAPALQLAIVNCP